MRIEVRATPTDWECSDGFTLTELLAVLGVLVILLVTVLPALGRSQLHSRAAQCQHNLKQLAVAWQTYAEDNGGRIVPNNHGGDISGGPASIKNWARGWLDWGTSTDNTNVLLLIDARYALLASYVGGESNLFKCPADQYLSLQQRARGWAQRVRSYSANIYIGEGNGTTTGPNYPIYKHVKKTSEFLYPPPAQAWVYLEEHPDSINDPAFFSPGPGTWIDWPVTYHNGAANFAFSDGHTESRKWRGSLSVGSVTRVNYTYSGPPPTPLNDQDVSWMSFRTPRVTAFSY
jgi:prepilin-type processing-associated H-X9-DG protein/prepilin-type N-terminal cleavage/methylation domain-containing protein